jgi:hypothetical protein
LSTDTGHVRDYNRDPYGSYNPAGGYYTSSGTLFPLMDQGDRYPAKRMVLGARTTRRAAYFDLKALSEVGLQETEHFLGIYDRDLETGFVYEKEDGKQFEYQEGVAVEVESGEEFAPGELPLSSAIPVEGFYFAWAAFYPDSEYQE